MGYRRTFGVLQPNLHLQGSFERLLDQKGLWCGSNMDSSRRLYKRDSFIKGGGIGILGKISNEMNQILIKEIWWNGEKTIPYLVFLSFRPRNIHSNIHFSSCIVLISYSMRIWICILLKLIKARMWILLLNSIEIDECMRIFCSTPLLSWALENISNERISSLG